VVRIEDNRLDDHGRVITVRAGLLAMPYLALRPQQISAPLGIPNMCLKRERRFAGQVITMI